VGGELRIVDPRCARCGFSLSVCPVVNWCVIRQLFVAAALGAFLLAGCRSGRNSASPASARSDVSVYHLRGKVVSTDPASGVVVLNHEAIPGFMDAMTMPYQLKNAGIVGALHPGDTITADVLVSKSSQQTVLLDNIDIIAQARPDYKPAFIYHVPAPGDMVPDFALRNQDGREIHLRQFRGKALLITFIYTRCPLPNFCPLITRNFAVVNKTLAQNPKVYGKTQLLCVSFDTEHDTPARLRAYGAEYLGSDADGAFAHWQFAVPAKPVLTAMARFFDVGITYGSGDSITHTLSTTLIGPDGRVVHFYPGNEWTPQQVATDITRLESKTS
jgi:protein SCO1/2